MLKKLGLFGELLVSCVVVNWGWCALCKRKIYINKNQARRVGNRYLYLQRKE